MQNAQLSKSYRHIFFLLIIGIRLSSRSVELAMALFVLEPGATGARLIPAHFGSSSGDRLAGALPSALARGQRRAAIMHRLLDGSGSFCHALLLDGVYFFFLAN